MTSAFIGYGRMASSRLTDGPVSLELALQLVQDESFGCMKIHCTVFFSNRILSFSNLVLRYQTKGQGVDVQLLRKASGSNAIDDVFRLPAILNASVNRFRIYYGSFLK